MTGKTKFLVAASIVLSLPACTANLGISQLNTTPTNVIPNGVPYPLYFDQFKISATYQISNCEKFAIEVTPEVAEQIALPDPDQTYMIAPNSMAGLFRTSELTTEYHPDGSVSSINAKAEDRTAEAIASIGKGLAGIVKIAAAGGAPGGSKAPPALTCSEKAQKAFDAYKADDKNLKDAKDALTSAQERFATWLAKVDGVSQVIPKALQTDFDQAYMGLQGATSNLAAAKRRHDKLAEAISFSHEFFWPESGSQISGDVVLPTELLKGKLDKLISGSSGSITQPILQLSISQNQTSPMWSASGAKKLTPTELKAGIPYRSAAPGNLTISVVGKVGDKPEELLSKRYTFRQMGRIMQLPCSVQTFGKTSCSLTFTDKGTLSKAGRTNEKAAGEAFGTMFSGLVDSAGGAAEATRARQDRQKKAEATSKKEQLDMLELDAKIAAAEKARDAAPPDSVLKALNEQILQIDTERKLLEAERTLREERAKVSGQ